MLHRAVVSQFLTLTANEMSIDLASDSNLVSTLPRTSCVCDGGVVPWCTHGGQKTAWWSWYFLPPSCGTHSKHPAASYLLSHAPFPLPLKKIVFNYGRGAGTHACRGQRLGAGAGVRSRC